ncbi:hypothetical protein ERO13_D03G098400v2 [Gossypium hirsutum]|uniref:Uncharacterized protein n=1 Tax=Gossypium hirsutum TaxID=3635 RepID=A0A1U8NMA7_GOSHI|nr:uncharacterized protein LOC107949760 [Gossypium hirsutum]KAG4155230.1 hypothetical protein ERO13_D03G098400v2 [Gossypium hirsutum]KAG4155231.1 hypothetical protein ERO13_D03G098400v2 [Gossypium hirsutum]
MTSFGTTIITITTNKPSPLIPFLIGLVISTSSLPPKPISLTHTTAFRSPIPLLSTAPICSIAARTKSTSSSISSTNASNNLSFGVIEGNHELDLRLDLGFNSMDTHVSDVEIDIGGGEYKNNHFFVEMRVSGLSASEVASNFSGIDRFGDSMWIVGFRSDSEGDDEDENDNRALTFDLNSGDDYSIDDHVNDCCDVGANDDVSVSIPLFWDSLQLEDRWETIEDFEWEEMDGRVDYNAGME